VTSSHDERVARADLERIRSLRHRSQSIRKVTGVLRSLGHRSQSIGRVTGLRSIAVMGWLAAGEVFRGKLDQPAADTAVPVRVKALDGRPVWLRRRSYDRAALDFLHYGHHLPPAELAGPVRQIAVFGANIGLLLADLAERYPHARLLGVEPDRDNAALARRNLAHLGVRCTLVEAAVWHRDETLTLSWQPDAWGQALAGQQHNGSAGATLQVDAVDAGKLLAEFSGQAPVDYLLVNIESAWYEMLRHGDWTQNVRCIKIEIQDHYDEAVPLLEALGYQAWLQWLNWGAFPVGIRR
jgi:FkbM family methyltransferase